MSEGLVSSWDAICLGVEYETNPAVVLDLEDSQPVAEAWSTYLVVVDDQGDKVVDTVLVAVAHCKESKFGPIYPVRHGFLVSTWPAGAAEIDARKDVGAARVRMIDLANDCNIENGSMRHMGVETPADMLTGLVVAVEVVHMLAFVAEELQIAFDSCSLAVWVHIRDT